MTFTELEYLSLIAVAVLLWRNAKLDEARRSAIHDAERYAYYLIQIGKGKGKVNKTGDRFHFQELKEEIFNELRN
jgi:hypothetical protein